jgi:hypothetical protein
MSELERVYGAILYGEIPSENRWWARVTYNCPFCHLRHIQRAGGTNTTNAVFVMARCNKGEVCVVPYPISPDKRLQ